MEFTQVVENRYSCKNFSGRKVEAEKLQVILEAGRVARPAAMALPPAWWWPLIKTMCLLTPARSGIPAWRMPLL